jgi:membrane-associated phospholipid phosphatase
MRRIKNLILFSLLFLTFQAQADSDGFWTTTWKEIASPVTTQARWYLLGGAALTGTLAIDGVEDSLGVSVQNETVEDKPLGHLSVFGDIMGQLVPNAIYFLGNYGINYFTEDEVARKRAIHMLKSTTYAVLATTIIKPIARERRPNGKDYNSFPSGHSTSAFAFAAVVGTEHEWYWGAAAYTLAGLVAYSRINDNQHRLHDVVGGAVIGISYGLSIHYLYTDEKSTIAKFSVAPLQGGLLVGYHTSF